MQQLSTLKLSIISGIQNKKHVKTERNKQLKQTNKQKVPVIDRTKIPPYCRFNRVKREFKIPS